MRGRMVRAANCSFNNSLDGTITFASTVHSGTRIFSATFTRHCSGSRIGFSSPITIAGRISSQNFSRLWSG